MTMGTSSRAEKYRQKAAECELAAVKIPRRMTQAMYRDVAQQWLELARRLESLDRENKNSGSGPEQ
jgi:hypothetical protein